jgi:hypothetical protein
MKPVDVGLVPVAVIVAGGIAIMPLSKRAQVMTKQVVMKQVLFNIA